MGGREPRRAAHSGPDRPPHRPVPALAGRLPARPSASPCRADRRLPRTGPPQPPDDQAPSVGARTRRASARRRVRGSIPRRHGLVRFPSARSPASSAWSAPAPSSRRSPAPRACPGLRSFSLSCSCPPWRSRPTLALALLPLVAIPLGAAGAIAAAAAVVAFAAHSAKDRAILGGLSFCAYLIAAVGFGVGDRLKIAPQAEDGWTSSASEASSQVLVAFTDPSALGGIAVLAAAAVLLGVILRAHPALALVGTVIWAAAPRRRPRLRGRRGAERERGDSDRGRGACGGRARGRAPPGRGRPHPGARERPAGAPRQAARTPLASRIPGSTRAAGGGAARPTRVPQGEST